MQNILSGGRALSFVRLVLPAVIPVFGWSQVTLNPGDNIQQAVDQYPAGTTFVLNAGTYRLQSIQPKDGDTFVGQPGAVLSGAQVLTAFSRVSTLWVVDNQYQQGQTNGYCDAAHPQCMHPEDLYFDSSPLLHVEDLSSVAPGTWFFDYSNHKIYFADDPTGHLVETSVARSAFWGPARNIGIRGLIVEKYAIPAQFGAIGDQYPGPNWVVANNEVRWNHGSGINLATGSQALNNNIHHNGQKGIGGNGQNVVVDGNEIAFNNWAGFDCSWEAGGAKFAQTNALVVRNNSMHDNIGAGLWNDVDSVNTLYENNRVENNLAGGIQYEISYGATIRNNTVRNNANFASPWMWGAQILIMNSRDVEVYGNWVDVAEATGNGIGIVQQNRGSGTQGSYLAVNDYVHNNTVIYRGSPNGISGLVADYNVEALLASGNNVFDYNSYYATDTTTCHWRWIDYETWDGIHQMGQELHGTLSTQLPTAIGLVQSGAAAASAVQSVSAAFPSDNAKGNLILAFVRSSGTSQTVQISDTAGNIYTQAVSQAQTADGHQIRVFYAANIPGGRNTVTATFSGRNNHPFLAIYEYRGVGHLDRTAAAQGWGSLPSSGATANTSNSTELVFAAVGLPASYRGTVAAGSGFTLLQQDAGTSRAANEAAVVSSIRSFAGTFTLSASAQWSAVIATFSAAGSPASPTITTTSLPAGTENIPYSSTLAATGGSVPYTWSIIAGSMPAGLALASASGTISGTPTVSGTATFSVQVKDNNAQTATRAFSLTINSAAGNITLVQAKALESSGVSSISVSFSSPNTPGSLIIASVRMSSTSQTVSIVDTAGNVYTRAVSQSQTNDGHQVHIFYASRIAGGANTVTAAFSSSNNHPWLAIYEYRGLSALDRTAAAQGWGASASSGATATTSSPNELVFAAAGLPASYTGVATAAAGFTLVQQDTGSSRAANETAVASAAGSFTGAFGLSSSANWTAVIATFRP